MAAEPEEAADVYLERTGVSAYLKDVATLLLENQPDDPVDFAAEYFRNVVHGSNPLSRSYRYIASAPKSRETFMENLAAAYAVLADSTKHPTGVAQLRGAELARLLHRICQDFPDDVRAVVFAALNKKDTDPVTFAEFACAVRACLYFRDALVALRGLTDRLGGEDGGVPADRARGVLLRAIAAVPRQERSARAPSDEQVVAQGLGTDGPVRFEALVRCMLQLLSHRL